MTPEIQKSILGACARFIRKQLEPITREIGELKSQLSTVTKAAPEPVPVPEVVKELLSTEGLQVMVDLHVAEGVSKHFEEHPVKDGESVSHESVKAMVDEAVKAIPAPHDGKSVTAEEVLPALMDALHKAVAAIPRPKDGEDGKSVSLADLELLLESAVNKWALEFERRAQAQIERAVDRLPVPKDGKDGVDFAEVEFDYDGERTLTIRGKGGEITKRLPIPIDRGYYRQGMACEKGDVVTESGSAWIALTDTDTKPGHEQKDAWRMMARRGKDGDKGDPGKAYVPPAPVKLDTP
jgi:hypothetical protein